ncbi:hypothetical protein [Streptomyces sp. B21-102]
METFWIIVMAVLWGAGAGLLIPRAVPALRAARGAVAGNVS